MAESNRLKILVIDDNEMTRAVLRTILHSDDQYQVVAEATNGISGLESAIRLQPDIICLDVIMPGASGLEILEQIKDKCPATTVLMVTGNNERETVRVAIERGASGFIIKPFNAGTVLDTVDLLAAKIRQLRASLPNEDPAGR